MSARWARKRALLGARDASKLPARKVHPHLFNIIICTSLHFRRHLIVILASSLHNSPVQNTPSSTTIEHSRLDIPLRLPLSPWSPSQPLRAGFADDILATHLVHFEILLSLGF